MKRINALIVMTILGVGSIALGDDKILFDGKQAAWYSAEIKADPENADNKLMFCNTAPIKGFINYEKLKLWQVLRKQAIQRMWPTWIS